MKKTSIPEARSAAPARLPRDAAMDYLRLAVIVLVVFLHTALAYASFSTYDPAHYVDATAPVVDSVRWPVLDPLILLIDTFAMPLLFLVSGLFVFSSLERKGSGGYFRSRLMRLGVPFLVAAFTLSPLAFWPGYLRSTSDSTVPYWIRFFTTDGWQIGAPWFLWVLLGFDGIVALIHRAAPALLDKLRRPPAPLFILLATAIVFVPCTMVLSPYDWLTWIGPFDVQPARLPLFILYFVLGIGVGASRCLDSVWPKRWGIWLLFGLFSFAVYLAIGRNSGVISRMVNGLAFAGGCTGLSLGFLGAFHRFANNHLPALDLLTACSFGVYLFHYPIVHWLQFGLLSADWAAPVKFAVVFAGALALSVSVTILARMIPGLRRFL